MDPEVLVFTAGKDALLDTVLVEPDCIGSAAHVTMLSRLRLKRAVFKPAEAKRVVAELVKIMRRARDGSFNIGVRDQDVHMAVERSLTRSLGDTGRKIHTARSRNDQVAVDLRLHAKEELILAMEECADLAAELIRFARRHKSVPMVGRTHMQPAMPSSVGLWASAHAESLLDDIGLLKGAYDFNDRCPLGSAAGYGVTLRIDRDLTARLLGFKCPQHNVLYAGNARGKCEAVVLSAMSQAMISLSRFAEDLVLYTMPEFGYFRLPAGYTTGSSIMPQKANPDVPELVRARAGTVLACSSAVAGIVQRLPSGYSRDLQETKEPFINGVATTRQCLRIMAPLVRGLEADRKALRRGFTPEVFATDRALELVAGGLPFREAYNHVKNHLGDLAGVAPEKAVARRKHLGAPAGLDFDMLRSRASEARSFAKKEERRYYASITRLLGVKYPDLV